MAVDTYDDLEPINSLLKKCNYCEQIFASEGNYHMHRARSHGIKMSDVEDD